MDDVIRNENYYKEGLLGDSAEALLIRSNELYQDVASGTWQTNFASKDGNMQYKVGCDEGKRFVSYTQHNVEEMRMEAKRMREQYLADGKDPSWKVLFPFANYPAMHLPKVLFYRISHEYFDGKPWDDIKRDPVAKNQFYMVVNRDYADFVIHPSGKIPLQLSTPFPKSTRKVA